VGLIGAGTFLMGRCIAMEGWIHFTEPLPSNDMSNTHKHANFVKYADVMGSGSVIYIPSFMKTGSCIGKYSQDGNLINLLLFYQNKEIRLREWSVLT
jgi:hypothetical protein